MNAETVKVALQVATADEEVPPGADWSHWAKAALDVAQKRAVGCITVRLVGRSESQHLNSTFRDKDGPTNVLAFPGYAGDPLVPGADAELGDLVICLPVACKEATAQRKSALAHMAHLVVHGTLHLVGYDHQDDATASAMESLETKVMLQLGFPGPYEGDGRKIED